MKRIICEDCLNREVRLYKNKNGETSTFSVCSLCKQETRRMDRCPLGFTEEIIAEIYRRGEMADKERYFKESMAAQNTDPLINMIKELAL